MNEEFIVYKIAQKYFKNKISNDVRVKAKEMALKKWNKANKLLTEKLNTLEKAY